MYKYLLLLSVQYQFEYFLFQDMFYYQIFFFFCFFRATPVAYGGSQARGPTGAIVLGYATVTAMHLQPTPQLIATPDP